MTTTEKRKSASLKVAAISDTHWQPMLPLLKGMSGDVLIHAGDSLYGVINRSQRQLIDQTHLDTLNEFVDGLKALRAHWEHIIVVPGNHDQVVEVQTDMVRERMSEIGVHLLVDEYIDIEGIRFYGSPWTKSFMHWFYMMPENRLALAYDMIDPDTDVLITHGPPYGILDTNGYGEHLGSPSLLEKTKALKRLKLHVFGHIHGASGQKVLEHGVLYANVGVLGEEYDYRRVDDLTKNVSTFRVSTV